MAGKPKYKDAKTEYVQTPGKGIGLRKLAIQWGIPLRTIAGHSKQGGWVSLREQYHNTVATHSRSQAIAVTADKQAHINIKIAESLVLCGDLVHKCLKTLNKPLTDKNFGKFKSADLILRSVKSATESINNLDIRVKEIYGPGDSKDITPADIAAAVRALALSQGTIPTIPRSEIN